MEVRRPLSKITLSELGKWNRVKLPVCSERHGSDPTVETSLVAIGRRRVAFVEAEFAGDVSLGSRKRVGPARLALEVRVGVTGGEGACALPAARVHQVQLRSRRTAAVDRRQRARLRIEASVDKAWVVLRAVWICFCGRAGCPVQTMRVTLPHATAVCL